MSDAVRVGAGPAHHGAGPSPTRGPVLRPLAQILPAGTSAQPPVEVTHQQLRVDPRGPVLAEAVLRAAVEYIAGHRAGRQLSAVLTPPVMSYLTGLRGAAGPLRPRLRSVRCQQPAPGALEVNGVVLLRTGARAVFARFELAATRWRCTSLHLPLTRGDLRLARRGR